MRPGIAAAWFVQNVFSTVTSRPLPRALIDISQVYVTDYRDYGWTATENLKIGNLSELEHLLHSATDF